MSRTLDAAQQATQQRLVLAMAELLRGVLAGTTTRAEVERWARAVQPKEPLGDPFRSSATASTIYSSVYNLARDAEMVRDQDLAAYLRWLGEGRPFRADPLAFLTLLGHLDRLVGVNPTPAVRFWWDGLGWWEEVRFASPATGRPFLAQVPLRQHGEPCVLIHKLAADDAQLAALDLFESLAIDDRDVVHNEPPSVDLTGLPVWELWRQDDHGQRIRMDRFRSRAKAVAAESRLAAAAHKQTYWVEPGA